MGRAEKRAEMQGTMLSDYPSSGKGAFNYHSGMSDGDACGVADCSCVMFVSPFA
jgi:hypothetical protein